MQKIESINNKKSKLVLVTAMTSNKSGIGKTTISIGLSDALNSLGVKSTLALREPSMGPVFGIKGGATGGGKSIVEPSDEINLHFTGDFHAIAQSNNLLSSIIDNHIFQGNALNIDTTNIFHKRCLDINDRSLRNIEYEIRGEKIKTGFNITASSEVMAIVALSHNIQELKENLGNILVALDKSGNPIFARDLQASDAMTIILKDAMKPNLVKTREGNPALIHLGPFANIAHGCNSIVATETALSMGDICVTEAGFGSDLGAEKFLNIKCRKLGFNPSAVVLVVNIAVIKEHGNGDIVKGFENVKRHIHNITNVFGLNMVVAINKHPNDTLEEIEIVKNLCEKENIQAHVATAFADGGKGCIELAKSVINLTKKDNDFKYVYSLNSTPETQIKDISTKVYGAKDIELSPLAKDKLQMAKKFGFKNFFMNIAKTQFSFTDDKNQLGAPTDFTLHIKDIEIRSGAKMLVAVAENILLMPGLGKNSNYLNMNISDKGEISGLF